MKTVSINITFPILTFVVLLSVLWFFSCHPTPTITITKKQGIIQIVSGAKTVAELRALAPPGMSVQTEINETASGVFKLHTVFSNPGSDPISYHELSLEVALPDSCTYAMIPSVNYNGNAWGQGGEPKGFAWQDTPWVYAVHRTAIPGATYSEDANWAWALFADDAPANLKGLACSLVKQADRRIHRLLRPDREYPRIYSNRDVFSSPEPVEPRILALGDTLHITSWLVALPVGRSPGRAWSKFLDLAWQLANPVPASATLADTLWRRGVTYAQQSLWAEEGTYRGFSIGLIWQAEKWIQRPGWKYEIGWCGQNISLANSLLYDYQRYGHPSSLDKALTCLDTWSGTTALPNGLVRTHYDYILGLSRSQERLDACNLGTAALNFFEASVLTRQVGQPRARLDSLALGICDFIRLDQEPSGRYGKSWAIDGTSLDREGTIGAFLIPPMLEAFVRTTDSAYLLSSIRAHRYYYEAFSREGYTSAGALDTYCIDKESAISLLRSALKLFHLTQDRIYLDQAIAISYYLSTWLWHYDYPYADTTDFRRYGWSTFGATAVSVQHHHLDPYALLWVPEWLELARLSGDKQWQEKAQAIWFNGSQLVADGRQVIHSRLRPVGAQNEAFFQTAWSGTPGSFNDWLVAWPTAFRLETLRKLPDWSLLVP